ncbi:hypothetical protein B0H13DRAFT_2273318 [Mycena leptocephala]|nr:hypothetical protein B0H13DRAFT_2273318 [Mycena leptocephala]
MSSNYSLLVQRAVGITWKPGRFHSKKTKFYVIVHRDGVKIHQTPAAGGAPAPKWDNICIICADGFVGMDGSSKGKAMGTLFVILMKDREAATFAVDKSKKDMQTITLGAATSAISAGGMSSDCDFREYGPVGITFG